MIVAGTAAARVSRACEQRLLYSAVLEMPLDLETFAQSRGFTAEELTKYGVRVEGDRVVIPCLGRQGAWYERTHHPNSILKYESPKGSTSHLYNPAGVGPGSDEVWIAEGEFDTLSLIAVGVAAVGVLGAGNFNRHWQLLFEHAEIVIAFDNDDAGHKGAGKLAQLWEPGQVSRFDPSPYEDLNDWFRQDRAAFQAAVLAW